MYSYNTIKNHKPSDAQNDAIIWRWSRYIFSPKQWAFTPNLQCLGYQQRRARFKFHSPSTTLHWWWRHWSLNMPKNTYWLTKYNLLEIFLSSATSPMLYLYHLLSLYSYHPWIHKPSSYTPPMKFSLCFLDCELSTVVPHHQQCTVSVCTESSPLVPLLTQNHLHLYQFCQLLIWNCIPQNYEIKLFSKQFLTVKNVAWKVFPNSSTNHLFHPSQYNTITFQEPQIYETYAE